MERSIPELEWERVEPPVITFTREDPPRSAPGPIVRSRSTSRIVTPTTEHIPPPPPPEPIIQRRPSVTNPVIAPAFHNVRSVHQLIGDLDPDIAMWPSTNLQRWPFTGPPTEGIWPRGWVGVDNETTIWVCIGAGQPGTWEGFSAQEIGDLQTQVDNIQKEMDTFENIYNVLRSSSLGYRTLVMASNPVSYWPLDADADDVVGSNNGTASSTGVTFGVNGPWGADGAAAFDGTAGYISVPYTADLNPAEFTVEVWALLADITSNTARMIVSSRNSTAGGYAVNRPGAAGSVASNLSTWTPQVITQAPNAFSGNHWVYLVGTFGGGQQQIYANGVLEATTPADSYVLNPSVMFAIGRDSSGPSNLWSGSIAHVAIYDRALSANEIAAHYAMAPPS